MSEQKPWYDTLEGIESHIDSLENFRKLIRERKIAYYDRKEELNEFYVFGIYYLDSCGNCAKAEANDLKSFYQDVIKVISGSDFKYLSKKPECFRFNDGMIPSSTIKCSHCNKTWSIKNCYDVSIISTSKYLPLEDFVGQTLSEVKKFYAAKADAEYTLRGGDTIVKNGVKYLGEGEGVDDNYIVSSGDFGYFHIDNYFHTACRRKHNKEEARKEFKEIFEKAGFGDFKMMAIPNQYCSCIECAPWFNIKTYIGTFKIGWRKHVINIDWTKLDARSDALLHLFENEKTTKSINGIHAHNREKAQEYLTRIHKALSF